jgi:hypothetical protein
MSIDTLGDFGPQEPKPTTGIDHAAKGLNPFGPDTSLTRIPYKSKSIFTEQSLEGLDLSTISAESHPLLTDLDRHTRRLQVDPSNPNLLLPGPFMGPGGTWHPTLESARAAKREKLDMMSPKKIK